MINGVAYNTAIIVAGDAAILMGLFVLVVRRTG